YGQGRHAGLPLQNLPSRATTAQTWCVAAGGAATGGAPCANATAIASIQQAVNGASSGDEIRIANGTYTGSGAAVAATGMPLTLAGGYPGGASGWGTPGIDPSVTVIDGQGARPGIMVQGAINVTV